MLRRCGYEPAAMLEIHRQVLLSLLYNEGGQNDVENVEDNSHNYKNIFIYLVGVTRGGNVVLVACFCRTTGARGHGPPNPNNHAIRTATSKENRM